MHADSPIKQTRAGKHAFDGHMEELRRIAVGSAHGFTTQQAAGTGSGPQPGDDPAIVTSHAPRPSPLAWCVTATA
jgi:hypothetical protein